MPDNRGHLLPVYVVADESYSMNPYATELNSGMASLYEVLRAEPMVAAKVRRPLESSDHPGPGVADCLLGAH